METFSLPERLSKRGDVVRWSAVTILGVIAFLAAIGQSLPSILLQPTKSDLGMSDTEIGLINGLAVTMIGAVAAFPIGWAADRYGRKRVLALSIFTWSAFVLIMAMAQSVTVFAAGAVGFNLGDAALLPLIYGMIAATFRGKQRDLANATLVSLLLVGSFGVYAAGGALLELFASHPLAGLAPWRMTCLVIAGLGPLVAALLLLLPQPLQHHSSDEPAIASLDEGFLAYLRQHGAFIFLLMTGISLFYTAFSVFMFWAPAVLERAFAMPAADANAALGQYLTLASVAAIAASLAILPRFTVRRAFAAPMVMVIIGCGLVMVPAVALLFVGDAMQFLIAASTIAFGMSIAMMLAPGLMQSCAPDRFRSRTIALFPLFAGFMRITQPALVGWLSSAMGETGEVLLSILAVLMIVSFGASILILLLLTPRFTKLARANAD